MPSSRVDSDRQILRAAREKGKLATLGAFMRLSGPGWLQSAITLGGGSLASSLLLGILAGYSLMWLQPLAMILGIIMLSAIGYVTLSTGERPLRAINDHVNPVLGGGWAFAVAAANIVWCMPQYSLANGVLSRNLLPGLLDENTGSINTVARDRFLGDGPWSTWFSEANSVWVADNANKLIVAVVILILSIIITWSYDRGGFGLKLYETLLKIFVGIIVLCFVGVVIVLARKGALDWGALGRGLIPDLSQFWRPAKTFDPMLEAITDPQAREYWSNLIVAKQQGVIISAAATAVGINMTFLFPYSLLRKGWTREFRGLAMFDLATGMLIPYVLATGCVVIAASAEFHAKVTFEVSEATGELVIPEAFKKSYDKNLAGRLSDESLKSTPDLAEQKVAAALVDRKADDLSSALVELTGPRVGRYIFGIGVLAMTMSTITILMLISGFVTCEILSMPPGGWTHRVGTLFAGVGGAFGPFVWDGASFYLAIPTSVFGFVLLPFAYVTFMLLMNQKSLLGRDTPTGYRRVAWNTAMGIAAGVATIGSIYTIWNKAGYVGVIAVAAFGLLTLAVAIDRKRVRTDSTS